MPTRGESYRFSGERRREYVDALSRGAGRVAAARAIGVNRSTISRYCVAHPAFAEKVREAEHAFDDVVLSALAEKAASGDVKAAALWLAARQPEVWQPARRLTVQTDTVHERAVHAPQSPAEQVATAIKLEQVGHAPTGSAAALEAYFVTSGQLPRPALALVAESDIDEAEVVDEGAAAS